MKALVVILIILAVLILLYLLAIMPRFGMQKQRERYTKTLYAHRGLHDNKGEAPENSMAAFQKAVKAGYGIELDVQLTKDGVPVVFHDFTLDRICHQEGKVCEYTWEELKNITLCESKETIPGLAEVLRLVNGQVPLIIEYKVEWMDISVCAAVDKLLKDYKGVYCIESFNPLVLLWYRRYRNDVFRGQLSDAFIKTGEFKGLLYVLLQNLLLNWMTKPDFVAYNHKYERMLSRRLCHGLYRNTAAAWTITSSEELENARGKFDIFIFDSFLPRMK